MASKVEFDGIPRRHYRRMPLALGCGCAFMLLASPIVYVAVYGSWAANRMPDIQPEAEILAAGGRIQRESIMPRLSGVLDSNLMPYGTIWEVTYRDPLNYSPLTEQKMKPLADLQALKDLTIVNCQGSDRQSWGWLSKLSALEEFTAIDTDIRDEDLQHLRNLPRLRRVNLWDNPRLTREGVAVFYKTRPELRINFPKVPEGMGPATLNGTPTR